MYIPKEVIVRKCANCNQNFNHKIGTVIYTIDKKEFCTWNCKCEYRRKQKEKENERIRAEFFDEGKEDLGSLIRKYRRIRGLTKLQVQTNCNVSPHIYRAIEANAFTSRHKNSIIRICKYLQIPKWEELVNEI